MVLTSRSLGADFGVGYRVQLTYGDRAAMRLNGEQRPKPRGVWSTADAGKDCATG